MNEVTTVHLGRQAFTISVDAHHKLKTYLSAVAKQVNDAETLNEIELRMAELLMERGLNNTKVVLPEDVAFLINQLGTPAEFKESDDGPHSADSEPPRDKRLFRDPDNGLIAGVAAGLASYFGLDVLLVRLLFVILVVITLGWGLLLYILLWLLVPKVKTPSDRLQMTGKPVTVDSIKEIIDTANVKGAAYRVHRNLAEPINMIFGLILKAVGLLFVLFGLSAIFGLIAGETYFLSNNSAWVQGNIFPVGVHEQLALHIGVSVIALLSLFVILFGMAILRRKWPIRTWVTGILIGLIFIGLAAGGALAATVYPNIRDRYNANTHTSVRQVTPFTAVSVSGDGIDNISYQVSDKSYVVLSYYGHPNLSSIKTTVKDGTLLVDSTQFNWHRDCRTICMPSTYHMSLTLYGPNALQLENQDPYAPFDGVKPVDPVPPPVDVAPVAHQQ